MNKSFFIKIAIILALAGVLSSHLACVFYNIIEENELVEKEGKGSTEKDEKIEEKDFFCEILQDYNIEETNFNLLDKNHFNESTLIWVNHVNAVQELPPDYSYFF